MSTMPSSTSIARVEGDAPYDVVIGSHLRGELSRLLGDPTTKLLIISPAALAVSAAVVRDDLAAAGHVVVLTEVPDAEASKTAEVASACWQVLGQAAFTRSDAIVSLGGGATTDLAGFVASTWLRGVRVIHLPTTLLAMVDAAVGGKTGINTAEGKNLVGTFHPPVGVLCDLASLGTLPRDDYAAGLAEVIKCGFIADPEILTLVERDPGAIADPATATSTHLPVLHELIERSVAVKAHVVGEDLREAGLREILNYGHTFAHAIEQTEHFTWRHGAAVSVGMVFAAELARLAGRLGDDDVARHRSILASVGLPISYRADRWDQLHTAMRRDKKARGDLLRFVVLDGIGRPSRLEGPDPALLLAAYASVGSDAPSNDPVAS